MGDQTQRLCGDRVRVHQLEQLRRLVRQAAHPQPAVARLQRQVRAVRVGAQRHGVDVALQRRGVDEGRVLLAGERHGEEGEEALEEERHGGGEVGVLGLRGRRLEGEQQAAQRHQPERAGREALARDVAQVQRAAHLHAACLRHAQREVRHPLWAAGVAVGVRLERVAYRECVCNRIIIIIKIIIRNII